MNKLEMKLIERSYQLIDLPQSRFKHFSFLVRRNKILAIGWNYSKKSHPICKTGKYRFETLHSESSLYVNSKFFKDEFYRLKIYNVRINNNGEVANSKPCVNCQIILEMMNIKEVWYTTENGTFEQLL